LGKKFVIRAAAEVKMAQASSNAVQEDRDFLSREIKRFYANRDQLRKTLQETQEFVETRFAQNLSAEFSSLVMQNLQLDSVWQLVNRLFNGHRGGSDGSSRPCIIIAGQTKSGKSSFINELLGGTFVAQSQSPCTARVTRLTYSDRIYVLVRSKTGEQIGDVQYLEKPTIEEDLVKLKDEDRENDELISSTVEAGIKCEFLRHGIDIIDSPGLNENSSLDSLTLGAIDSFLPIIIYVIDSNSGVTVAVQKDLQTIQKTASGAEILYLITKMDVADHLAAEMGREVAEMEAEKADHVFSKLQRLGYISKDATRQSCRKFLCVSCWEVRRFRRKKEMIEKKMKKSKTAESGEKLMSDLVKEMENSKWVRQFEEVKRRILQFAQDQFKNLIVGAGSSLRAVHCQILTMFMDKAHDIKESNQRKKKALYQIKSLEHEIHQQSKSIVERHRGEFLAQANRFFAEKKPLILDEVRSMSYSDSVISEGMSQRDIEKKCIEEIHTLINDRIIATFSDFLRDNVLRTCFTDFDDLKEKVAEYEKDVEQTPAYQVLKKTLLEGYSLSSKAIVRGSVTCFIRNIGSTLRALLKHPDIFLGKAVQHHKWKEHQASQYLKNIDREKLVACLVSSIGEWFDKRHSDFLHSMSYSEVLVEKSYRMTDRERKEIIKLSPIVALLHMNAFAIITRYKFRNHRLDLDNCLGSGAQGRVYTVLSPTGEPVMAAKKIVTNRAGLEEIAAEAYYSSVLEHPNIVRVVGTVLLENAKHNGQWSVELYMELMHCDALTLMEQQRLSLAKRLWLGLQISKALEFLHSSQLIHRDVKLANLLVNSEATVAKLSDFGLLKGQGLVGHTLVGTPIYLSPELVRRENYGVSTDIFSLGIALWYLVEGSGQHHPDYVTNLKTVEEVLAATSERGCRPNRLPEASDQLWQLMVRCWDETPAKRPTAGQVSASLEAIIKALEAGQ
ncbi:hypothetical protein BOX15_Mlig014911g1, partial [Macrostomum lignano]